jgi:hypothetical protein
MVTCRLMPSRLPLFPVSGANLCDYELLCVLVTSAEKTRLRLDCGPSRVPIYCIVRSGLIAEQPRLPFLRYCAFSVSDRFCQYLPVVMTQ